MSLLTNLLPQKDFLKDLSNYPDKVRFENQEDQEEVVLLLRTHPIKNISWIITAVLLFFIPNIFIALNFFLKLHVIELIRWNFSLILSLIWYLFVFSFVLEKFLGWYFNVFIVTNKRIVDIDFYGLIYKDVSEVDLSKIQDVSYKVGGFAGVMLNFGTLTVQTAAEVSNVEIDDVPHPDKVAQKIGELSHINEIQWRKKDNGQ